MQLITGKQVVAARGLIGWSQQDLATAAKIGRNTVARFERSDMDTRTQVRELIYAALTQAGIEFTTTGVNLPTSNILILEGPDNFSKVLDDVFYTLKDSDNKEILFTCVDDSMTLPHIVEKELYLRRNGIKQRCLIEEGNTYIPYPLEEYRYIPKKYFHHTMQIVYGKKVVLFVASESKATIIEDFSLSTSQRNLFNLIWDIAPKPIYSRVEKPYA